MLRVVDISSHQAGIDIASLDCDAVIVKATGGTDYVNGHWKRFADAAISSGKLLGLYHYAMEYGRYGSAREEADHFLSVVGEYASKAVIALDFEADAQGLPVSWAREWLDIVADKTGATPMFYAYASYLNSRDHSEIAGYPLWMASYLDRYGFSGWVADPVNIWATSSWQGMTAYQYTSTGRLAGWSGNLDLSVFYGDREDWKAMEGGRVVRRNEAAANFHWRMCVDPRFGYTQGAGRWGQSHVEDWEHEGVVGKIRPGDRDCSSSVCDCWREALRGSPYEGALDAATYTGDMRRVFVGSGLFDWHPMGDGFIAQTGDVYLNERHHTAMCISPDPDTLSEFYLNEFGGITGGQVGDQTGGESRVRGYYDFPWDGILHYNGKADTREDDDMSILTYKNPEMNGDKDVYQLLTDIHRQLTRTDTAGWENPDGHDMFGRLQDVEKQVREVNEKLDAISAPQHAVIEAAPIDYDALAAAMADVMAARMRD